MGKIQNISLLKQVVLSHHCAPNLSAVRDVVLSDIPYKSYIGYSIYKSRRAGRQIAILQGLIGSRDNWLRTGRPRGRSSSSCRVKNFLFFTSSRPALESTELPNQWVPVAVSPGVKRPGREAEHSPPASAEVKKMWIYTSTPTYVFMA
jgi:hypothetical protein